MTMLDVSINYIVNSPISVGHISKSYMGPYDECIPNNKWVPYNNSIPCFLAPNVALKRMCCKTGCVL